jgi:hypothetical protein
MKINELIEKRSNITSQIDTLLAGEMNDEVRTNVSNLEKEYDKLGNDIKMVEDQAKRAKVTAVVAETRNQVKPLEIRFQNWLQGDHAQPFVIERASTIQSTTDTAVIEKQVVGSIDVLHSPARAALQKLGTRFYQKNGTLVLPAMAENTAKFVGEGGDASTADMATASLTLTPRRISAFQPFSFEFLNETNPQLFADYLQNLIYGYDLAIANDLFDQIDTDAATQKSTFGAATLSNKMIVQMDVSMNGLGTGQKNIVTTPAVKGYLKNTIALGTTAGPAIWTDNEVNGIPAMELPSANASEIYLGDFSRSAVLETGTLKVIYDEVTRAKQGETVITIVGGADTGVINPRAFVILTNASIG